MNEDRTERQIKADIAMSVAVAELAHAYEVPEEAIVTGYIVLGAARRWTEEGIPYAHDFTLLEDNGARITDSELIGMLRVATLRAEKHYLTPDDDD